MVLCLTRVKGIGFMGSLSQGRGSRLGFRNQGSEFRGQGLGDRV